MSLTLFRGRGSATTAGDTVVVGVPRVDIILVGETTVVAATTFTWAVTGKPAVVVLSPMM
jgi:hypothetical protein